MKRANPKREIWNLYDGVEGSIYYNATPYKKDDKLLLRNVDPDVIWKLEFNKEKILKYYKGK